MTFVFHSDFHVKHIYCVKQYYINDIFSYDSIHEIVQGILVFMLLNNSENIYIFKNKNILN